VVAEVWVHGSSDLQLTGNKLQYCRRRKRRRNERSQVKPREQENMMAG
jgi:hypothetical protein